MRLLARLLEPRATAHAHCDLPCGVYDPAQARIEAESVKAICQKYQDSTDPAYQTRALIIKEQRSELVKHHLWVLWTDYFKPPHFEKYPQLHMLFNEATKLAGAAGTKGSVDVAVADELLAKIEEISNIFWETKQG
jgi:nickel superoxide dismutase